MWAMLLSTWKRACNLDNSYTRERKVSVGKAAEKNKNKRKCKPQLLPKNPIFLIQCLQCLLCKFTTDASSNVNSSWKTEATGEFFQINTHRDFLALSWAFRLCTIMAYPNLTTTLKLTITVCILNKSDWPNLLVRVGTRFGAKNIHWVYSFLHEFTV